MLMSKLTPRQREVALLVPSGITNSQIGQQLSIKESVVKNYLREIYDRLGVWTRLELAVYVIQREGVQLDA
jgi:two-component system, NarL family, nitrate/nitrite response regulator NarL